MALSEAVLVGVGAGMGTLCGVGVAALRQMDDRHVSLSRDLWQALARRLAGSDNP
ncbi:hypothetical protein [Actinoplanes sp. GCM10030250]|uniref:hypothetical protein n=1 Tax=Actinoplanes sp. GCM10030250 TaxID=3273376 RepID=UPI00361E3610